MPGKVANASLRAFFAVELESLLLEESKRVEEGLLARIASDVLVRWTHGRGRHVTLRFLGSFGCERVSELVVAAREALADVAPFDLCLGSVLAFPSRRVRFVAIDPKPHGPLRSAACALERAAVGCGFEPEPRPFRPHVTLGRVKQGHLRAADLKGGPAGRGVSQRVGEIVLFRSELHGSGATYRPLERIALGGLSRV